MRHSVISLFSGCGGLDLGILGGFTALGKPYERRNFDIIWAGDMDSDSGDTYLKNIGHDLIFCDIESLLEVEQPLFLKFRFHCDVVVGGFPCQDFSLAGKREGTKTKRGRLYQSFLKVVSIVRPKMFLIENVTGLLSMDGGALMGRIAEEAKNLNYSVEHTVLNASDFGVPQDRRRVFIVGTLKEMPTFVFPKPPEDWVTVGEAIGDLEHLIEGAFHNHFWSKAKKNKGQGNKCLEKDAIAPTIRAEHHGNIEFHWNGERRLSAREAARIQSFPDDFMFCGSNSSVYKQIGNAVPPVLAWYIGGAMEKYLDEN